MDFIPVLAIVLVLTTVIACLVTGQRLGEARKGQRSVQRLLLVH